MGENKKQPEKKNAVLVWEIFRWIAQVLLALLLIMLIFFQAPWKIITLLSIVLAACTILPMPFRKWFWLSVAFILLVLVIWVFVPEDNYDWSPFTFDDEITTREVKYAIPDKENAAVIYNGLLQDFDPRKMNLKFLPPGVRKIVLSEPWIGSDYPELVQWLSGHETVIRTFPQVYRIRTCRFPGNYKLSVTGKLQINRYVALKSWAVLLMLSGNNDIAENRINQGLLKYLNTLRIADHLYQQKRMVDFLQSFTIENLTLIPISRLVIEESLIDKQLRIISDDLTNLEDNWSSDFLECLEHEKLYVKNTFCSLIFEKDLKDRIRYSRNPAAAIWQRLRLRKLNEKYALKVSMKAYAILAWFTFPATPQKVTEIIESTYEEYYAMTEAGFDWDKQTDGTPPSFKLNCRFLIWWLLTKRTSRPYSRFHDIYLKRLAQRRGLSLLIAIKQYHNEHGTWPESLDEIKHDVPPNALVDPTGNDDFVYTIEGNTFRLYSKGINNIDEAGRRDYIPDLDKYQDDIAIWPLPVPETGTLDNE